MEKHPLHLKNPELQTSSEVQRAVEHEERIVGQKVPNDPVERIEVYLKRLEKLILDPNKEQKKRDVGDIEHTKRPRALSLLREMVMSEYVRPNKEQMAQGAMRVEQRAARQMGVQAEYNDETLEQRGEIAVGDLESSLDQWINYLSDSNEPYPTWFRYYVFRNILNLGEYDKDKQEFPKRSKGTFKLFPDIDRGALAYVEEIMTAAQDDTVLNRIRGAQKEFDTPETDMWTRQKAQAFANMSFAKQYAEGIKSQGEITPELRAETRGEWVHYHQGESPKELWKSLQNKGTAWCTRGYPTAETQLKGGDFYVYYTIDATGKPTIPRIAIRMEGQNKIAEPPRGVFDSQQNLEPNMVGILDEKLKEFGNEADTYRKKSLDMKRLTAIEHAMNDDKPLTRDDLLFLYEIDGAIEGFGYDKDPRIKELRSKRDRKEDIEKICDCPPEHIVNDFFEITESTQVFCEDTGTKIAFCDFREAKNQAKIPQLIELAKNLKESGSLARPDISFEGGIVSIDIDQEKIKDLPTALTSYENADNKSPSWILPEWRKMKSYTPPEATSLNVIILSYNSDTQTRASSDKILADMDKAGLRPATIAELVALGIAKPEFNKRDNTYLVGLGTKELLVGVPCVPSLFWSGVRRFLGRDRLSREWNAELRFVCLRK